MSIAPLWALSGGRFYRGCTFLWSSLGANAAQLSRKAWDIWHYVKYIELLGYEVVTLTHTITMKWWVFIIIIYYLVITIIITTMIAMFQWLCLLLLFYHVVCLAGWSKSSWSSGTSWINEGKRCLEATVSECFPHKACLDSRQPQFFLAKRSSQRVHHELGMG